MFPLLCKEAFLFWFMFHCPLLFDKALFFLKKKSQYLSLLSLLMKKELDLKSSSFFMVSDSICGFFHLKDKYSNNAVNAIKLLWQRCQKKKYFQVPFPVLHTILRKVNIFICSISFFLVTLLGHKILHRSMWKNNFPYMWRSIGPYSLGRILSCLMKLFT